MIGASPFFPQHMLCDHSSGTNEREAWGAQMLERPTLMMGCTGVKIVI